MLFRSLRDDLEHIATNLVGPYNLSPAARAWGEEWYETHSASFKRSDHPDWFRSYLARKQTHVHKLAMILAASCRDELVIERDDLVLAVKMITDLETDMPKVFSKIGRTENSIQAERLVDFVVKNSPVPYSKAYAFIHVAFPFLRDFESIVAGAMKAGLIKMDEKTATLTRP